MKIFKSLLTLLVLAGLAASSAQAQTRTWVSGVGDDLNPCSRTAPCKTFAGAISKTAAGGEISVLDPGGFGAVTITKAITINGDGTLAGILNSLTNGIIVNAGANDNVVIRNISIHGGGNGLNGIRFLAGKSLTVDNVTISGFTGRGIDVTMATGGNLNVRDTRITGGATGIFFNATAGLSLGILENVSLQGLTNGLEVGTNSRVQVAESEMSNNSGTGVLASSGTAQIVLEGNVITFNGLIGINCNANAAGVRISNNQIYNNSTGIQIAAGCTVNSTGNNRVAFNNATTAPNGAAITQQ